MKSATTGSHMRGLQVAALLLVECVITHGSAVPGVEERDSHSLEGDGVLFPSDSEAPDVIYPMMKHTDWASRLRGAPMPHALWYAPLNGSIVTLPRLSRIALSTRLPTAYHRACIFREREVSVMGLVSVVLGGLPSVRISTPARGIALYFHLAGWTACSRRGLHESAARLGNLPLRENLAHTRRMASNVCLP